MVGAGSPSTGQGTPAGVGLPSSSSQPPGLERTEPPPGRPPNGIASSS